MSLIVLDELANDGVKFVKYQCPVCNYVGTMRKHHFDAGKLIWKLPRARAERILRHYPNKHLFANWYLVREYSYATKFSLWTIIIVT